MICALELERQQDVEKLGEWPFEIGLWVGMAAMPWTGEVGAFFGRVDRVDSQGFYGPYNPTAGRPLPVDRLPPQGRSPKVIMLRVYLALLGTAQKAYVEAGGPKVDDNPADRYMTSGPLRWLVPIRAKSR